LRAGTPTLGCWLGLGSVSVAELMGHVGFDWLVVEMEHCSATFKDIEEMLRAIAPTNTPTLVRVPSADPGMIGKSLDLGADGVVVPMIRSATEATAVVAATRYPPRGTRSFGPMRASAYYRRSREYLSSDNDAVVVLIVETPELLGDIANVVAVTGIDVLYMGPFDLSLSVGADPFDRDSPQLRRATQALREAARKTGVPTGTGVNSTEGVTAAIAEGHLFLGAPPDYALLNHAADAARELMTQGMGNGAAH